MSLVRNKCFKGKSCGSSCINRAIVCRIDLPKNPQSLIQKAQEYISANSKTLADHIGKGAAAWKTGKVLGNAISSYLESRYGIPREVSIKLAETAVQGAMATALDFKHLKSGSEFAKKLTAEIAAAFIGKSSHSGMEGFLEAKEIESTLNTVLPVLAGKLSGIGTAVAASKIPGPSSMLKKAIERSKEDIEKIKQVIKPGQLGFSELGPPMDILGDLTLIALYLAFKEKYESSKV